MLAGKPKVIASTIKEQVYRILKDEICSGGLKSGQWLQEVELAERLKVSRSPIREALRLLSGDGLVVDIPNKGVFVREFTEHDIEEIYDMRVMMESYALLNSHVNLDSAREGLLREYLEALVTLHDEDNLNEYMDVDSKLHALFIALSGNSLLEESYRKISSMVQQFRIYSLLGHQRFDESVDEHCSVVTSILDGATQKAVDTNHKHLMLARDKVLEHLRGGGGERPSSATGDVAAPRRQKGRGAKKG